MASTARAAALLLAAAGSTACSPAPLATPAERVPAGWQFPLDEPPALAVHALIATDAPLASQVGAEVLRRGGNAVDAAIATAFALAVVYPEAGNLGGGGFMVIRMADGVEAALDFREKAPLAATADMFVGPDGEVTDASLTGHLASGVPGSVAGLWEAHRRFGSRPWAELVEPAIRLADDGFVVDARFHSTVAGEAGRLRRFPASAELFLPDDAPPAVGSRWRNPDLARTLRRVAEGGAEAFYRGEVADLIAAEMRRGGGLITTEDLARYEPAWRDPVVFTYRGHRVVSMPPASSGGLTLGRIATILEGYDLAAMGWNSAATLHVTAEAMRRAFAERNRYLGDSDFVEIPAVFLSREDAAQQRATIRPDRATASHDLGVTAQRLEADHTTHVSLVDAYGNAVAFTTTINLLYGSAVTVTGAGFLLNDEMDDFTAKPGVPNAYGLVQGTANAIEPGKRMLSAMTPTVVVSPAGEPLIVTGARGGPRIISAVWQIISNVVDHGMGVSAAVNMPRVHHQHLPDVLGFEAGGVPDAVADSLRSLGHDVQSRGGVGAAPTVVRAGDRWAGVADPRSGGAAIGH
jgi:gamma-glutamyltranspeptidase / glutathione hydrolase